jgi:hypothetical protein
MLSDERAIENLIARNSFLVDDGDFATGTYGDRFEKRDGRWMFAERSVQTRFAGDTSRHRQPAP